MIKTYVFSTDNEEIQKGIENHYKFGSLFRFIETKNRDKARHSPNVTFVNGMSPSVEPNATEAALTEKEKDTAVHKVVVTDLSSAKDYLADKFGISRTSLRSSKAIIEQAAAHGIEFEGI